MWRKADECVAFCSLALSCPPSCHPWLIFARGGAKSSASAYIRISPEEIADDYPFPVSYEKEEEETDEMLLFDEDMMDADPEYLPRRLLHDFAIYNAEVRESLSDIDRIRGFTND